jgi:hypothetical protein
MERPLDADDIDAFVQHGFVRLRRAFSPELADQCRRSMWQQLDEDPDDPSTWTRPVVRLGGQTAAPFREAMNTARLHAAFDQLVGAHRWTSPPYLAGTVPVRFPVEGDPGDDGWHVDGAFERDGTYYVNIRSDGRALLMLALFTDVDVLDAPTRLRVGSHLIVPSLLLDEGDQGLTYMELAQALPPLDELPIALATGERGDVYLCHPFLVHAADRNRGTQPRFVAQPGLLFAAPLDPFCAERGGEVTPVGHAIRAGLTLARLQ